MSNVYGIDIGTSNFKMCCKEKDTILNEKNIIAIANKKDLLAFGDEAVSYTHLTLPTNSLV